ncbi:23336_t:CDS:1 [Dentiscutata erythropus]|uniref:23336_t:CDS:1 n=1 Tax=Dentiscutata erythropus TaxID=1348616 RepID=A0A9N9IC35_9GLOM|nr:23336_t:CDS:1 [Dentiscutata erythropus]
MSMGYCSYPYFIKVLVPIAIEKKCIEGNEKINEEDFFYEDKIPLGYLLSRDFRSLMGLLLFLFSPYSCLSTFKFEPKLRRTEINNIELEGIKRFLLACICQQQSMLDEDIESDYSQYFIRLSQLSR